ncbi:hypothetical protein AALI21_12560 [Corynebacteriaceae bacterium 6-324]
MSELEFICSIDELESSISEWKSSSESPSIKFGVTIEDVLFPVFLHISDAHSERLTVLYNGAVSRERCEDGIVFQRSSWKDEIPSCIVSFADPTLVLHDGMSIGWGQVDGQLFAPEQYKKILDRLRDALQLPGRFETLHYGSSAGGFQALATAGFDRGSRVLCNNPQTDFSKYSVAWATNRALKVNGFANRAEYLESDVYSDFAWRVEIHKLYQKLEYIPDNIRLLINAASENDLVAQAGSFVAGITEISTKQSTNGYEVYYYFHPSLGHNPLPKPQTINELIAELEQL